MSNAKKFDEMLQMGALELNTPNQQPAKYPKDGKVPKNWLKNRKARRRIQKQSRKRARLC